MYTDLCMGDPHTHTSTTAPQMYKLPLQRQSVLTPQQLEQLFPSLEELILFHGTNSCPVPPPPASNPALYGLTPFSRGPLC